MKATIAWLRDDTKTLRRASASRRSRSIRRTPSSTGSSRARPCASTATSRRSSSRSRRSSSSPTSTRRWRAPASATCGSAWRRRASSGSTRRTAATATTSARSTRCNLFEQTIPKEYTFEATKNFKIRYHNEEKAALARYLEPTMERAFADMVKRYGFTPKTPVTLELYADKTDYAVRTVGPARHRRARRVLRPGDHRDVAGDRRHQLGHGAVARARPRVRDPAVELARAAVVHRGPQRVRDADRAARLAPRERRRPLRRGREQHAAVDRQPQLRVHAARHERRRGRVLPVGGHDRVPRADLRLPEDRRGAEALRQGQGDARGAQGDHRQDDRAARRRLPQVPRHPARARTRARSSCRPRGFDDVTKLEIAADAAPKDAKARAYVALGYYYAGDADKAGGAAQQALALDSKQPIARYILAEIAVHAGDAAKAKALYTGLIADGHDSYDLRTRLAQLALEEGNTAEVEKQLCAAKKLDPERSYPYQALRRSTRRPARCRRRWPSSSTTRSSSRWSSRRSRSSSSSTASSATGRRSARTARWRRSSTRRTPRS